MADRRITLRVDVCVAEDDYDVTYEYLSEMRHKITNYVDVNFDCASESYVD